MQDEQQTQTADIATFTADIVAAYVSKNSIPAVELPALIKTVHAALGGLIGSNGPAEAEETHEKPSAGQIRKSVHPDHLVSFLDGKHYKTLKRHLATFGLDPQGYRLRFGLPADYPMVAPNYAAQRSALAKSIGLGRPGGRRTEETPAAPAARPRTSRKAA